MPRFFITGSNIFGGVAYLSGEDAAHLRVLRVKRGETFTICDGSGTDYNCRMASSEGGEIQAEIIDSVPSPGEPSVKCSMFAAFSKGDRMDTMIQKCVELGAHEIILFPSARCVSRPDGASLLKKSARWQKIAKEAAKQSERGMIPAVSVSVSFEAAVAQSLKADLPLFLYENEDKVSLKSVLSKKDGLETVSIFTGPEGGFEPEEAAYACQEGMISVSIGPRILRCETAPMAALAAVMFHTDNM